MSLLYRLLTLLLWPVAALVVAVHPRLRPGWRERLGFPVSEVEPGAVWIHAASLGEGRAAEALIVALRAREPEISVVRTCTSDVARGQRIGADQTLYLPVDVPFLHGAWIDRMRPRCLLLVEAEVWPGLLLACAARGVPVAVVGATARSGTRRLLRLWPALARLVTWVPADAEAASVVGGTPIGELKQDAPPPPAVLRWAHADAIVAGSTHAGEEEALLRAVATLASAAGAADPTAATLLVLAPRDRRRFDEVAALIEASGVRWVRRSRMVSTTISPEVEVLLLDSIGELAGLYERARAAFVGGTFSAGVGGHSPAEPLAVGVPVVHGPFTQGELWKTVETFPALSPEELPDAIRAAFAARRASRARVHVHGAPARAPGPVAAEALSAVKALLDAPPAPERPLRPWLWPFVPCWMLPVTTLPRAEVRAPIPVITIGGLAAGGSGKTPIAAHVARLLPERAPFIVARGYGRDPGDDVRLSGEARHLGDELAMLARRGLRVVSSPDRLAGVLAAQKAGAGLAILDDGLQTRAVASDLVVITLDARWPRAGGPIPVGSARLPISWLARADVVWVNHGPLPDVLKPHVRSDAILVEARYRPVAWRYRGSELPLDTLQGRRAVAFAGIARPAGFFRMARQLGVSIERTWIFPDHYSYSWHDLQSIEAWLDDHVVVTTEKDAARLPPDAGVHVLVVEPEIVRGADALAARLSAL